MKKLTLEEFSKIKNGEIFKVIKRGDKLKFIVVKGDVEDWALYYDVKGKSEEEIKNYGYKAFADRFIREIVPCDDEVFELYRY